jgi:hypothetical protein
MEKTKIALLMEPYNREDQVCTFIGSSGVIAVDADKIKQLASKLSKPNRNMVFRSLHNRGAAGIFNEGISELWRLQRVVKGHAYFHFYNRPDEDCPPGKQLLKNPEPRIPSELTYHQYHILANYMNALHAVDIPIAGEVREIYRVMISGIKFLKPSSVVFFYEHHADKNSEDLAYYRELCKEQGIPFFDQEEWMKMLD